MQSEAILRVEGLSRTFDAGGAPVHALQEVTLDIRPGTLVVLRGRSGSGKTTLLNLLAALDRPTEGKIWFAGEDLFSLPPVRQDALRRTQMGYVFQAVALMGLMSAYENVEFALRLAGIPRDEWQARTHEALLRVGLQKRMAHRPAELSGGEQQRVAIARALVHSPKVLFADEPTAELDSRMGMQVMQLFRDLVSEGTTVVMSTHDPAVMELADAVFTLQDGRLLQQEDAHG